jgi:hypothetical protein
MALELSDREFEAVLSLDGPARYDHLIRRIADGEEIYGLRDADGWMLAADDTGRECMPVWPHPRYAAACAQDSWAAAVPTAIPIDDWLDTWLTDMEATDAPSPRSRHRRVADRWSSQVRCARTWNPSLRSMTSIGEQRLRRTRRGKSRRGMMDQSHSRFSAMTVNERLAEAGLLDAFDVAARGWDRERMMALLQQVELSPEQASKTTEMILRYPKRYGY